MARTVPDRDVSAGIAAAATWCTSCLVEDGSLFSQDKLWTADCIAEVHSAFIGNPDEGPDDFMTKLKGQMSSASALAKHLTAEMLWALFLFPSNIKAATKRQHIHGTWSLSGSHLPEPQPLLADQVIQGIGSGGPGFNTYRYRELAFLIEIAGKLKANETPDRRKIVSDYDRFVEWIDTVPQEGNRQYRHMLRYFLFPDRVERMSSNGDRRKILVAYGCANEGEVHEWSDRRLDDELLALRKRLEHDTPGIAVDFYNASLWERWSSDRKIKTVHGEVAVSVPTEDDDDEGGTVLPVEEQSPITRQSLQIQAKLAEIGSLMGFRVWIPRGDRERIRGLMLEKTREALISDLPLNYDQTTLDTIEQIDVLWLRGRSMARAFEVEHTTAIYSGLLRMADLLALQPNMDIRLHIVAPEERRDKVFREMTRPVFTLLDRGPLARSCTFLSYEGVELVRALDHLAYTSDAILQEYEEHAPV